MCTQHRCSSQRSADETYDGTDQAERSERRIIASPRKTTRHVTIMHISAPQLFSQFISESIGGEAGSLVCGGYRSPSVDPVQAKNRRVVGIARVAPSRVVAGCVVVVKGREAEE